MLRISADGVVHVTGGEILTGDGETMGIDLVVDSRLVAPGSIFVALPGERVDGHDFIVDALRAGARVVLVTRQRHELVPQVIAAHERSACIVRVNDAVRAVQDLAAYHRGRLHATVVGVTGSTGKTTTKDFIRSVLSTQLRVISTEGNRNNELGVPLTVLRAGSDTDALVIEMGMRGIGQIARLAEISAPDIGLVTNVGTSHMELLGTQDAIAEAKGELVRAVKERGAVFLNGDDAYSDVLAVTTAAPVTRYGLSEKCSVRAVDIVLDDESRASFRLITPQGDAAVALPVPGRHNVYNALAAAAIGLRLAVPLERVAEGLASAEMTGMRMETFSSARGVAVINDAYNANPTSMRAAIETLGAMRVSGRKVAVLGDMGELGSLSELAHFKMGEQVPHAGIDVLITVGALARRIADGARVEGMSDDALRPCETVEEAIQVLEDLLESGDAVLVKASRFMGLERVVEGIVTPSAS